MPYLCLEVYNCLLYTLYLSRSGLLSTIYLIFVYKWIIVYYIPYICLEVDNCRLYTLYLSRSGSPSQLSLTINKTPCKNNSQ